MIVLNDNHNTFDGVAFALASTIPGIDYDKGMALATKIDATGQAIVWSGDRELAELYHAQLEELRPDDGTARAIDAVDDIHRVFAAFTGGDARALYDVIAEDAVWHVPGTTPVSREYRGRDEIFGLFRETRRLTDGTYRSELRWALADGDHAVAVYRASGTRLGREIDIDQVLLIGLRDGRWQEVRRAADRPAGVRGVLGRRRRSPASRNDPVTHAVQDRRRRD